MSNIFDHGVEKLKSSLAIQWPHMNVGSNYTVVEEKGEKSSYCDHVINTITVRADGNVVPCCYDLTSQLVMGNIMEQPLLHIWNSLPYNNLRQSIERKQAYSICENCFVINPPKYLRPTWRM